MFSSNHTINFRQKLVMVLGFQLSIILLANVYCAHEMADAIYADMKASEEAGIPVSLATKISKSLERDKLLQEGWDFDPCQRVLSPAQMEEQKLEVKQIWFMEPLDIVRANMDRKFKEGKYLLFIDENKNVHAFDLTLPGYDTEGIKEQVKEFLRD